MVAIVQASLVRSEGERSLEQVAAWTGRAANEDAESVLIPDATIAALPNGPAFGSYFGAHCVVDPFDTRLTRPLHNTGRLLCADLAAHPAGNHTQEVA